MILVPHPLEPGGHAGVLLEERVLGPEGVVAQRVEVHGPAEGQRWVLWEAGALPAQASLHLWGGGFWPASSGHDSALEMRGNFKLLFIHSSRFFFYLFSH